MSQSPLSILTPSAEFVQNYIDSLEHLPLDIQRHITRLREYDVLYKSEMEQVARYVRQFREAETTSTRKKYLTKIQKCLVCSQQYGDEKLNIISLINEMIETHTQQLNHDAQRLEVETSEENKSNPITNYRMKMDKGVKGVEKAKTAYEKPKRQARRPRGGGEKLNEKPEKGASTVIQRGFTDKDGAHRYVEKEELEEEFEDEEMEEDEEPEVRGKKDLKRKPDRTKEKEKEKEKEKAKEEKEERKSSGKMKKTATPKQVSTKMKKKRKKEKESPIEDLPVDPDEPTYCICQSISYGDMIGCDNDDCEIEWFHFGCVSLTHKPKGKWYCPRCAAERKENKGKK